MHNIVRGKPEEIQRRERIFAGLEAEPGATLLQKSDLDLLGRCSKVVVREEMAKFPPVTHAVSPAHMFPRLMILRMFA